MRGVMKIEQAWLTELAPAQYQKVKVHYAYLMCTT